MLATALINSRVRNSAGENLGKIEDFVIDPVTGDIQYAIIHFDKLFVVPWTFLNISPSRDYVLLSIDKEKLERAPSFNRDHWPNMSDPVWRRSIHDYYGDVAPEVRSRTVYVERRIAPRQRPSFAAVVALIILLVAGGWISFLVATRGWDQAKEDMKSSLQGAAYAAKETSYDAALTTKVKTALSLSKRIPASQISVESDGNSVTLRGEVPSDEIRNLAEAIARDVPGVQEVHNHLFAVSRTQ
jgi:sporulation protein YlmC with PRC-barrel domain